jgi:uncharacterized protein YdeI (YjbR/CyaY-like superfamily)
MLTRDVQGENAAVGVMDEAERFEPATTAEWSDWLARNHARAKGVWLVTPRSVTGRETVDYDTSVVEALRYGWVDATVRTLDEERAMQWFSPRKPTSVWASSNKQRIERLRAEGRLEPAGEAVVRAAQANGTWTMFDDVERLVVPDDLAAALAARPGARDRWDAASPSSRRMALGWIVQARRPETRARRVERTAERAANGEPLTGA